MTLSSWRVVDDSGSAKLFLLRSSVETIYSAESSLSGSAGSSAVDETLSFTSGSYLGARSLNSVNVNAFWLKPSTSTFAMYAAGSGAPSYYWKMPIYYSANSSSATSGTSIGISGSLSGSSLNGGLSSIGTLGARSLSLSESSSATSMMMIADFISDTSTLSFTSGNYYTFYTYPPKPSDYSRWLGQSTFGIYVRDGMSSTRVTYFGISSITINGSSLEVYCRCSKSYSGSGLRGKAVLNLPSDIGTDVTQSAFISTTQSQTTAINNQSVANTDRMMDTTGSNSIVSGMLGDYDSGDFSNAMGVGDALNIVSGGFSSMLGQSASGVVSFSGLSLGDSYGGFGIPAFSVDIWSWCPAELATTIKTGFTAVAVMSWAAGMKKFFDRIFHGEQVVSTE